MNIQFGFKAPINRASLEKLKEGKQRLRIGKDIPAKITEKTKAVSKQTKMKANDYYSDKIFSYMDK